MGEIVVDAGLVKLAADAYVYGFPIVFDLDQVRRFVTTGVGCERRRTVQLLQPRAHAGRRRRHVRLDQQRHGVLDRAGRPERRSGAAQRSRLGRALLRAAVRRRVDEQLRLRRQARDRHGCARLPAAAARLGGRGHRGCHGDPFPDPHRHDRGAVGVRRHRRPACCARPAGRDDAHPVATLARAADRVARPRRGAQRGARVLREAAVVLAGVPAGAARRAAAGFLRAARPRR